MTPGRRFPGKGNRRRFWLWACAFAAIVAFAVTMMFRMPGSSHRGALEPMTVSESRLQEDLRRHVQELAGRIGERNIWRPQQLAAAGRYIEDRLRSCGLSVKRQD